MIPHYARFECSQGDATFSLLLTEQPLHNTSVIYFEYQQLDQWVDELLAKGIEFDTMPEDKPYLWREATLRDPSNNQIKLYWAGENRRYPPWRVSAEANTQ